jgi:uncharacterized protein YyaL (SSP411 family)
VKPGRDEKILTAWNGLMLASFAEAAAILERPDYLLVAKKNAEFVLNNLRRDGLLLRTYKDGHAKLNAYLEDYAFLIDALISLYQSSGDILWLDEAIKLTTRMLDEFWDEEEGAFFFTGRSHETLIVRSKDFFDNATPAGNSVAAEVLLRIGLLTDNSDYQRRAATILRLNAVSLQRYPSGFGRLLCALDFYLGTPLELVVIGDPERSDTRALLAEVWKPYLPNKVVAQASLSDEKPADLVPLLRDRTPVDGKATAFVCEHFTCKMPTTEPAELARQLNKTNASTATP